MNESEIAKANDLHGVDAAPPSISDKQKYPYIAIFIGITFVFIIVIAVSQQLQKTPEIANTVIVPTVTQAIIFISSPTPIPTSASLTVTPPKLQYTPLPTPPHTSSGSYISFVPDQAFVDSLPQIDSPPRLDTPDEYPSGWPNDLKLFPNNDSLRYVANVINKDVGFSVVLSMQYISNVFKCTNNEIDTTICANRLISRIDLSKDNPFSINDPTKWLLLSDAQRPHVTYNLIDTKGSLYQYKFTSDSYNKGSPKDGIDLWTEPGIDYSMIGTPTLNVPWKYFSALSFGCQYSCPRQSSVFVDANDPFTVYIVGYSQNGPFTQDLTGRAFDYVDTFRIVPK